MNCKPFIFAVAITAALVAGPSCADAQDEMGAKSAADVREDLGDIQPAPDEDDRPRFRAAAQMQSQFTTNAKMVGDHGSGDVLWLPSVEAGVNVPLGRKFSFDVLGRAETVLYSRYDERAFFGFSGLATLDYTHQPNWPRLYVGVEPYWYQSYDTGDRLSSATGLLTGIEHSMPFNRGLTLAFWGYKFTTYFASPSLDDRDQHTAVIGVAHQFQPSLFGQLYYSFQYTDFNGQSRHDARNIVGAALVKQWTENLFLTLHASLVDNDSSEEVASYQSATVGLGVRYQF